jgi:hypothetical protein
MFVACVPHRIARVGFDYDIAQARSLEPSVGARRATLW